MRTFLQIMLVFLIGLNAAKARAGDSSENSAPASAPSSAAAASLSPGAEFSVLELEIGDLRQLLSDQARQIQSQSELLRIQQQRMEDLEQRLGEVNRNPENTAAVKNAAASAPSSAVAASSLPVPFASPAAGPASPAQAVQSQPASQDDFARRIEERIARIGPFAFSGDFRVREERFMGGPASESLVRNRLRFRARLNMNTRLNSDLSGGLTLASGHFEDSISNNQDLDQFFTRKPFLIDRAFLTYTPHQFQALSVTGGKFAYTWYRTELTWDNDVNVEGISPALTFTFQHKKTPLKRVALVSFALPFAQTTGVNFNFRPGDTNRSIHQSVVYGGQLQTEWQLASWLKFGAYAAFYDWRNADPIALSVDVANPASPSGGTLRLSVPGLQNSVTTWTQISSVPATAGGTTTVNTSILNAQFASKFGLFDNIARFDVKTGSPRWPLGVIADFVQNTKACANIGNFLAPTPAPGATVTASANTPCNPRDRQAYWLESRFGRITERHDLQVAYTRMFIEREAVLGAFNFSEMRQNSNVSQHRFEAFYNVHRNVTFGFTGLFGRPLGALPPGEALLKRLQIDVLYRF